METNSLAKTIRESLEAENFFKAGKKTTIGFFVLKNGHEIVVSSSCANPEDYNEEIGTRRCREAFARKYFELTSYANTQLSYLHAQIQADKEGKPIEEDGAAI